MIIRQSKNYDTYRDLHLVRFDCLYDGKIYVLPINDLSGDQINNDEYMESLREMAAAYFRSIIKKYDPALNKSLDTKVFPHCKNYSIYAPK